MMKKHFFAVTTLALTLLMPIVSFGQYADHALKLSNLSYNGTARFTGMGGAFGAIGGDFTSLSVNPGGIGVYKNSEVTFTPLIYNTRSFSQYFNDNQQEFSNRLNISNAGIIFALPIDNNDFKAIQFGLGCSRLANFNNRFFFQGKNDRNTFVRALSDIATVANRNGQFFSNNPWYADELADAVNLLIYDQNTNEFFADMQKDVYQSAYMQREGGIDELVFTLGGNYSDMLYFGATLGLPFLTYWHLYQYKEWTTGKENFKEMTYTEEYRSDGSGVNGKFGVIFRPIPSLRIGAAIHTPTYYWTIQESEWLSMSSTFRDSIQWNKTASTPERQFEYSQLTPMRVIGSLAYTAGKIAVISADYEWVDHSANRLQSTPRDNAMNEANTQIRSNYTNQHIIRAGAELRWNDFYFRGGYGWYTSPFQNKNINNMSLNTWSLGIGFRAGSFGLDFAYQNARMKSKYYPYDADRYGWYNNDPSPYANLTDNANSYMLTFSFRY